MACIDEARVAALFAAQYSDRSAQETYAHAAECEKCRLLLKDAAVARPRRGLGDASLEAKIQKRLENARYVQRPPHRDDNELASGAQVGSYLVIKRRGLSGMGSIYEAYDPAHDRRVVLKTVRNVAMGEARQMAEARISDANARLSTLRHENLLSVYEVGQIDGALEESTFVAFEFVRSVPLSRLREQQPGRLLRYYLQAAHGLVAAHRAGVPHLAFHPDACVFDQGPDGRVRVMDFTILAALADAMPEDELPAAQALIQAAPGMAEAAARGDSFIGFLPSLLSPRTEEDGDIFDAAPTAIGQALYWAPEQLAGEPVGMPADQFAFCAALYHALYGHPPFRADDLRQHVDAVLAGRVVPPSDEKPVPVHVRDAIMRGLSRAPGQRFETMRDLVQALETAPEARRRGRGALVVAGVVGGVAGLALVTTEVAPRVGKGCEDRGEAWQQSIWDDGGNALRDQWQSAKTEGAAQQWVALERALDAHLSWGASRVTAACEAGAMDNELVAACFAGQKQRFDQTISYLKQQSFKVRPWAPGLVHAMAPHLDCLSFASRKADGSAVAALEAIDRELTEAFLSSRDGELDEARERVLGSLREGGHSARALFWLGQSHRASGELSLARSYFASAAWEAHAAGHDRLSAYAAAARLGLAASTESREHWLNTSEAGLLRLQNDRLLAATIKQAEAHSSAQLGDVRQAASLAEEALTAWESAAGEDDLRVAEAVLELAELQRGLVHRDVALATFKRAVTLFEAQTGPSDPGAIRARLALAVAHAEGAEFDVAKRILKRAAAGAADLGSAPLLEAALAAAQGRVAGLASDHELAVAKLKSAVDSYERAGADLRPELAETLAALAGHLRAVGKVEEAVAAFEQAEGIWATQGLMVHPMLAKARMGAALAQSAAGKHRAVIDALGPMADQGWFGVPDDSMAVEAKMALGRAYLAQRDPGAAAKQFQLAVDALSPGGQTVELGNAWKALGEAQVVHGKYWAAVESLTAARKLVRTGPRRARIDFMLAQALWESDKDRRRAVELATEARSQASAQLVPTIDDWLAERQ